MPWTEEHQPRVTDLAPKYGEPGGILTIRGMNFDGTTEILFGKEEDETSIAATTQSILTDTEIACVVPVGEGETTVLLSDGQKMVPAGKFQYA